MQKTLISYEQGKSIPNNIYLVTLLNSNKECFMNDEYQKNYQKITKNNLDLLTYNDNFKPSIYNGFTMPLTEKIQNMILFFADNGVLKTKLLKEMFYADFIAYKETGASISGLEYVKINLGPVPDNFKKKLLNLSETKLINYEIILKYDYEYHNIVKISDIETKVFNQKELDILKK